MVTDGTGTDYAHLHSVCTDLAICLSLSVVTLASFNSVIENNRRLRSLAMIQRVADSQITQRGRSHFSTD
jgi:hypothetical protein